MSDGSSAHSMPMGDTPMADHAMTMDLGPKDAEFDLRFIDGMILHHQGAMPSGPVFDHRDGRSGAAKLTTSRDETTC